MKTEKGARELERLCREYSEKTKAKEVTAITDDDLKLCRIIYEKYALEFVYSLKGNENYPISTLSCRVYPDVDGCCFFELPEIIDYLDIYDYHCYYFPYIENKNRLQSCFEYITDFIEFRVDEIKQLYKNAEVYTEMKKQEIQRVMGYNRNSEEDLSDKDFFKKVFRYYSNLLVRRYTIEKAYLHFIKGEYEEALKAYEKIEKKTGYEKKLIDFFSEDFVPYQAVTPECASIVEAESYRKASFKAFCIITVIFIIVFCAAFLILQLAVNKHYTDTMRIVKLQSVYFAPICGVIPGVIFAVAFKDILGLAFMKNRKKAVEFYELFHKKNESAAMFGIAVVSLLLFIGIFAGICRPSVVVSDTVLKYDVSETPFVKYEEYELKNFDDVIYVKGYYTDKTFTEFVESPSYAFTILGGGYVSSNDLDLNEEQLNELINIIRPGMEGYKMRNVFAVEDLD